MRRKHDFTKPYCTTVEMDGWEYDNVAIFYRVQPEEKDTNTPFCIEIESAFYEDQGCILDELTDTQVKELETEIADYWRGYDDERGDYLRDLRKDEG